MKIYLSGIQPSGALHLGNYFGMMQKAIALQDEGQAIYFIADYHALTSITRPIDLQRYVLDIAAGYLACGLNPEKTILFRQSDIPEVHELAWLLSVVTPMGLLERAHSYKDKVAHGAETNHGLFAYPVLMAADILLYGADFVPVGRDQKQHLEIARDIAQKFNDRFGPALKVPQPLVQDGALVPGLDGRKMSKSYQNTLELFGEDRLLEKKIMAIPTDSTPVSNPKRVEGSILAQLMQILASPEYYRVYIAKMERGGSGYGELKRELAEVAKTVISPLRKRFEVIRQDVTGLEFILDNGAQRARQHANPVLSAVRSATGLAATRSL